MSIDDFQKVLAENHDKLQIVEGTDPDERLYYNNVYHVGTLTMSFKRGIRWEWTKDVEKAMKEWEKKKDI